MQPYRRALFLDRYPKINGEKMIEFIKKQPPVRIIALGFALVIFLGSFLLSLPISLKEGVELSYADALYMSVSSVCVTGLATVDAGSTFSLFGQIVLATLIQIGGLGVTAVGAGIIMMVGKKMDLKGRNVIREAMNLDSGKRVARFLRNVFFTTLIIELVGACASFLVFIRDYSFAKAAWLSIFHSVATFNNSGFDVLGNGNSLAIYRDDIALNLITCVLIFLGGVGFLVIREVIAKRFKWKKFSMHTKVVLSMSAILTVMGTLIIKLTENISWLGAFFSSVSTRTAGFATYSLGKFSNAGIMAVTILMIIGASPGSTGGGIKTTTFFVLLRGMFASATNRSEKAFKYAIPKDTFRKASAIVLLAVCIIGVSSFAISIFDPHLPLKDVVFEMSSAFGTVGLSTGITPSLSLSSKIISMIVMYIGRLGPLTVASLWYFSGVERVRYPEGNIAIG